MPGKKTRSAHEFLAAFTRRFATERAGYLSSGRYDWTEFMYQVLHGVRDDLKLWCECKAAKHHEQQPGTIQGERLNIDFFWYHCASSHEKQTEGIEGRYQPPCIVIEHENHCARLEYNLWKVSQLAAPLRVLIGYAEAQGPKGVESRKNALLRMADSAGLYAPAGTEDLLLLSDYEPTVEFSAWWRPEGRPWNEAELLEAPQ